MLENSLDLKIKNIGGAWKVVYSSNKTKVRVKGGDKITWTAEGSDVVFQYPSQKYLRRIVELDSTGNFVIIKEFISNNEVRYPIKIPLEEYIQLKKYMIRLIKL